MDIIVFFLVATCVLIAGISFVCVIPIWCVWVSVQMITTIRRHLRQ